MKKIYFTQLLLLIIVLSAIIFSGCVKQNYTEPPQVVPYAQLTANATIEQILQMHTINNKNILDTITGDTIIQGIVTGNDVSGNIYKYMVIQDQTAGIVINVDLSDYSNEYKVGQKVFVKCKGLVIGDYSGLPQLGLPYLDGSWKVGRIPAVYVHKYIFKDGLPNDTLKPKVITHFSQIMNVPGLRDVNRLVTFENISFSEAGSPYSEKYFTTDRVLIDSSGNTIKVRTSNYADFAADIIPSGIGKITGILGYYASGSRFTYQLIIRDIKEVGPFTPSLNLTETFATSLGAFTQYSVIGDQVWTAGSGSGKTFAKMSGYINSSYYANEDWLISKAFDFSLFPVKKVSFESYMRYGSTNDGTLKAYYSTDYSGSGDPNSATWTELPGAVYSPVHSNWTDPWTSSGEIDLSAITSEKVYIAFKYICGTTGVPTWEITNVKISGSEVK